MGFKCTAVLASNLEERTDDVTLYTDGPVQDFGVSQVIMFRGSSEVVVVVVVAAYLQMWIIKRPLPGCYEYIQPQ